MKTPFYRSDKVHKKYLKVSGFLVASFAPICFLGTMSETSEFGRVTLDVLSWPLDGRESLTDGTAKLLSALLGGFLLGYGVTIWQLSKVYDKAPNVIRKIVITGLCSWFVLDSAGSIAGGHWSNALWNVPILLAFVGPLWFNASSEQTR